MKRKIFGILFAIVLVLSLSLVMAVPVSAQAVVTPATGGGAISADDTGVAWTTLSSILITEGTLGDITANPFTLTIPNGFEFNTASAPDVAVTGAGLAATSPAIITATTITVTVTSASTVAGTLTIGGGTNIQVRPTAGTPLLSGNILMTAGNINNVDVTTDFGTLTLVAGAANKLEITSVALTLTAGTQGTVTVEIQDQFGNAQPASAYTVNLASNSTGTYDFYTTGTTTSITSILIADTVSSGTFDYYDEKVGTPTITVTDAVAGLTQDSQQQTINPDVLASFTIIGTPAGVFAGAAFPSPANDITVTAYDSYVNVKTDYVGTVTWSSSSSASLPADYQFIGGDNGVRIFPGSEFILFSAGTHTITVTDGLVSAPSSGITVMPVDVAPLPDTTPPVVSDISASNITETSADICWKTNERSTSQVEYWFSPGTLSSLDETMVIDHLVHLTDLTPGADYHYKTMSKDRAGNLAVSDVESFITLGVAPAAVFSASDLSISPSEVNIGETVNISVLVANTGNATGDYEVTLKINDMAEATKEVTLDAGASTEVTFTTSKDKAATYSVDVNGLSGSFTVKEKPVPAPPPPPPPAPPPEVKPPINWPLIGGIIAAVVIVGVVGLFLIRRPRRIS